MNETLDHAAVRRRNPVVLLASQYVDDDPLTPTAAVSDELVNRVIQFQLDAIYRRPSQVLLGLLDQAGDILFPDAHRCAFPGAGVPPWTGGRASLPVSRYSCWLKNIVARASCTSSSSRMRACPAR